jgi:hypothetical protein
MKLYEAVMERPDRRARSYVVAPTGKRAAQLIIDQDERLGEQHLSFSLEQVDSKLPADKQVGLDDLLEGAPIGFASYCEPAGWFVHSAAVQQLHLFKVEDESGEVAYVVAPDASIALAICFGGNPLSGESKQRATIVDGLASLPPDQVANLHTLLAFGPVGIVTFDTDHGWTAW